MSPVPGVRRRPVQVSRVTELARGPQGSEAPSARSLHVGDLSLHREQVAVQCRETKAQKYTDVWEGLADSAQRKVSLDLETLHHRARLP